MFDTIAWRHRCVMPSVRGKQMSQAEPNIIATIIAALVVVLVLSFRMRRMKRSVPLRLKRLWIAPTIFVVLAALMLTQFPLKGLDWVWLGVALLIGAAFGWLRGRLISIAMDPADRTLTMQATPMAIYFLLGLVAIRLGLRTGLGMEAEDWGLSPVFINDIFVTFALGLLLAEALEMAIRARRLLAGDGGAGIPPSP
jgi:hypothetical protein